MLPLLRSVEAISACRDRDRLPRVLLRALTDLLGSDANVGILAREPQGEVALRVFFGLDIMNSALFLWPTLLNEVRNDGRLLMHEMQGRKCAACVLQSTELRTEQMILAFDIDVADTSDHADDVMALVRIYGNQIKLLDYADLDTLTRLLNRKTFNETFDRLLSPPAPGNLDDDIEERRVVSSEDAPAWLCVIDIDHFKRINDSFGHLFGDEVLLRMGDLLRKTFRSGDRLFRFGGEEFIVILNAADEKVAEMSFNRFRFSVESHEFPQVGRVTCSIGFTSVSDMDVPTDAVGRADEALYYAKEHGRNQVCCYERLIAEGALAKAVTGSAAPVADFDIDALFG